MLKGLRAYSAPLRSGSFSYYNSSRIPDKILRWIIKGAILSMLYQMAPLIKLLWHSCKISVIIWSNQCFKSYSQGCVQELEFTSIGGCLTLRAMWKIMLVATTSTNLCLHVHFRCALLAKNLTHFHHTFTADGLQYDMWW